MFMFLVALSDICNSVVTAKASFLFLISLISLSMHMVSDLLIPPLKLTWLKLQKQLLLRVSKNVLGISKNTKNKCIQIRILKRYCSS